LRERRDRSIASSDDATAAGVFVSGLDVSTKGSMRRRRRGGYGLRRRAVGERTEDIAIGQAVGRKTRMRAALSTTRAAI